MLWRYGSKEIEAITGNTYDTIYVVGGGANAGYLNELTAKYTKKERFRRTDGGDGDRKYYGSDAS